MSTYRDVIGKHAILKRITGLQSVEFKSRPAKYGTTREAFSRKDQHNDGEFLEEFKRNVIPGAVTGLAPFWNDLKDTYWPEQDLWILKSIIEDGPLKIRYPLNHPDSPGQIIPFDKIDPRNYYDAFFQSDDLKMKRMEGGNYTFELQKDPIDALLFYCYKNDPRVLIKDGTKVSKYVVGKAMFELVLPGQELVQDKGDLKREAEAMSLFGSLSFEKQKYIAKIMNLRVKNIYQPDPDELYVAIGNAAKDKTKLHRLGVTVQERFLKLANSSNEDLLLHYDVSKGIDMRIIISERNDYVMNGERIENVRNEDELFKFFKDTKNSEKYKDLVFLIEEKEKVT
ncbi:MAG: hypothetical protein J5I47_07645 [Vicingus serpentipes]|nr:hypothetical protein [Vicingus serpentipes]